MERTTLVLLAAGMGSRYGGVKQIDSVGPNGEAIIDYSIYDALKAGFTDLCFVVRAEIEEAVREFFDGKFDSSVGVSYVNQELTDLPGSRSLQVERQKPWGTAHAVYAARTAVKTPFAVINGDDFYGRGALEQVHGFLSGKPVSSTEYAMVGYRLADTLSPNGTVSRGICKRDDEGYLVSLEEHKKIEQTGDRVIDTMPDGSTVELSADDLASMNMFGFTPAVFGQIDREFGEFLDKHGSEPKSEFYIPTLMTGLISSRKARMRVLPTDSQWFGMTYKEDKPEVQKNIMELVERGEYPRKLWER
ncbi:MAG: NDP-sugar synthase [Spirochaetales bacterium]